MSTEEIYIIILSAVVFLLIIWIIRIEQRFRKLPQYKENKNISDLISSLENSITNINKVNEQTTQHLQIIYRKLDTAVRNVETIKFNPFREEGVGGNESFVSTFVDESGNGVLISSLYSRNKTSVFAKPIKNWKSENEFSEEEKEVLEKTKKNF